ncbi:TIGR02569 family protein [Tamaricihabitans halophyticus]|uniref:TIGR02569 family protein n=1 Tax=Tamaricihabitans halophyticus TaxID=1262583 RepID=UPI00104D9C5E|nr:TIGR02569 family protein [Tamaricihabitans halophyticus]
MSARPEPPPPHVCAAFGARGAEPELIGAGPVWRCGDITLKPVVNTSEAAWVAQALDSLDAPGVRIAQPLRSTDGRWVIGGWTAMRYVAGRFEPRYDDVVAVSLRLHEAASRLARPAFLDNRNDVFSRADRAAFGEEDVALDTARGGRLFDVLAASRRTIVLPQQVVHGDLFGNVLFAGNAPPAIVDFTPYWRPVEWAAAVVVVDAVAWGGADASLADRWDHLPEWPQCLLRALLFRLAVNALHPSATEDSLRGLDNAAHLVTARL